MTLLKNRKVAISLILTAIITAMSDTVFHLLLEFTHFSFELIEQALDMLVEHIFHTDRHKTQAIVFYLMLFVACYGAYRLLRAMPRWYREFQEDLAASRSWLRKEISAYWQDLSPAGKTKWLMGFTASAACVALWVFV